MRFTQLAGLLALGAQLALAQDLPDTFDFKVERVRLLRNQPGDLHVDGQGVTFRSHDAKTTITIPFQNLREADVADPRGLRFQAYDVQKWKPFERREYVFRAERETPVEALAQFLAARVNRPVVGY